MDTTKNRIKSVTVFFAKSQWVREVRFAGLNTPDSRLGGIRTQLHALAEVFGPPGTITVEFHDGYSLDVPVEDVRAWLQRPDCPLLASPTDRAELTLTVRAPTDFRPRTERGSFVVRADTEEQNRTEVRKWLAQQVAGGYTFTGAERLGGREPNSPTFAEWLAGKTLF